ncbi:phosphohydrolase [Geomonas subterranea]|uniref:phosphohydrolase n=1 Tax=Geomonas subterranea TaxID=2847989 RepID=UPI001CD4E61C|nr:phosphohydrolase [Geomonas fuzhouensis]
MALSVPDAASPASPQKKSKGRASVSEAISVLAELFPPEFHSSLFVVGGAVRDHIQGKLFQDLDLVTKLPPEQFLQRGFDLVGGNSTSPILFSTHPRFGKIEVTVLPPEQSLQDDLLRRDFRCNAILMSLDGVIHDPLGGSEDIRLKRLYPCRTTSLRDDPIRFFRALRFASHGWNLSPGLCELLSPAEVAVLERLLQPIPVERFTREMSLSMLGGAPWRFFALMGRFQLGKSFLPEMFGMAAVPVAPSSHYGEGNLLKHALACLRRISPLSADPAARLATFFHDIGALASSDGPPPWSRKYHQTGCDLVRTMAVRLRLPERTARAIMAAVTLHRAGGRWQELQQSTRITLAQRALKSGIAPFFPLLVAAVNGKTEALPGWEIYLELVRLSPTELGMDAPALALMTAAQRSSLIMQYRHRKLKLMENLNKEQEEGVAER